MDVIITTLAFKDNRMIATADLSDEEIKQMEDSSFSIKDVKKIIDKTLSMTIDADEFVFAIRYKNLNKESGI